MAHSSSGLGRRPLKAEITGSNPVCATKFVSEKPPEPAGIVLRGLINWGHFGAIFPGTRRYETGSVVPVNRCYRYETVSCGQRRDALAPPSVSYQGGDHRHLSRATRVGTAGATNKRPSAFQVDQHQSHLGRNESRSKSNPLPDEADGRFQQEPERVLLHSEANRQKLTALSMVRSALRPLSAASYVRSLIVLKTARG